MHIDYTKYPQQFNIPVTFKHVGEQYDIKEDSIVTVDDSVEGNVYNCISNLQDVTEIESSKLVIANSGQNIQQINLDSISTSQSFTYTYLKTTKDFLSATHIGANADGTFRLKNLETVPDIIDNEYEYKENSVPVRYHRLYKSSGSLYTVYGTNLVIEATQLNFLGNIIRSEVELFSAKEYSPIFNLALFAELGLWFRSSAGSNIGVSGNDDDTLKYDRRYYPLKKRKKKLGWKSLWYSVTPKKESRSKGVAIYKINDLDKSLKSLDKLLSNNNMYYDIKYFEDDAPEIIDKTNPDGKIDGTNIEAVMAQYIQDNYDKLKFVVDATDTDNIVSVSTLSAESYIEGSVQSLDIIGNDVFIGYYKDAHELVNPIYASLLAQFKYSSPGNVGSIIDTTAADIRDVISFATSSSMPNTLKITEANESELGDIFRNFTIVGIPDGNIKCESFGIIPGITITPRPIERIKANVVNYTAWGSSTASGYNDIRYRPSHFIIPVDYGYQQKEVQFKCGNEYITKLMNVKIGIRPVLITVYTSRTSIFRSSTTDIPNPRKRNKLKTLDRDISGNILYQLPSNPDFSVARKMAIDAIYSNYIENNLFTNPDGIELFKRDTKTFGNDDVGLKFKLLVKMLVDSFGSSRVIVTEYIKSIDKLSKDVSERDAMLSWHAYGNACRIMILDEEGVEIKDASKEYYRVLEIARVFIHGCSIGKFGEKKQAIWGSQFITCPDMFYWEVLPQGYSHKGIINYREMLLSMQNPVTSSKNYFKDIEQLAKWYDSRRKAYGQGFKDSIPVIVDSIDAIDTDGVYEIKSTNKKYIRYNARLYDYAPSYDWYINDQLSVKETLIFSSLYREISNTISIMDLERYFMYFESIDYTSDDSVIISALGNYINNVIVNFPSSMFPSHGIKVVDGKVKFNTLINSVQTSTYSNAREVSVKLNINENSRYADIVGEALVIPLTSDDFIEIEGNTYSVVNYLGNTVEFSSEVILPNGQYNALAKYSNVYKKGISYNGVYYSSSEYRVSDVSYIPEATQRNMVKVFSSEIKKYVNELKSKIGSGNITILHNSIESSEFFNEIDMLENEFGLIESQDIMSIDDLNKLYDDVLSGKNVAVELTQDGQQKLYIFEETISIISDAKVVFTGRDDFVVNKKVDSQDVKDRIVKKLGMKPTDIM